MNGSTTNTVSKFKWQKLYEQSSEHKALSSMKYQCVGRHDDLKPTNLNKSGNIKESKK